MGDQGHAQDLLGFLFHVGDGLHHLDAAALAAATGMDLGFHHPDRAAQFFGGLDGFLDGESRLALGHRHAESAQNLFGLIFVYIHGVSLGKTEAKGKRAHNSSGTALCNAADGLQMERRPASHAMPAVKRPRC